MMGLRRGLHYGVTMATLTQTATLTERRQDPTNIHFDVTGLPTVVWRSHSGQIVWPAGVQV